MCVQLPDGHVISRKSGSIPHQEPGGRFKDGPPLTIWRVTKHVIVNAIRGGSMTGDPVREAGGVFRDESPLRGAVYAPPMSGFDRSDIGVPAERRSIERGADPT